MVTNGIWINLIKKIEKKIKFPVLVLGGCGNWNHILELFNNTNISAACTQNIYHFSNESIMSLKRFLKSNGHEIRNWLMKICNICLNLESRPRISFRDSTCNACINANEKSKINYKKKDQFKIYD